MKAVRWLFIILGCLAAYVLCSWGYTAWTLASARRAGVYPSAEAGMLAVAEKYYAPDRRVKIFYAGPNEAHGQAPYVWFVTAEVRSSAYADGSPVGHNGCDAPGTFFVQLKDGNWVNVPEGFFTTFMLSWLETFDLVGEGQSTPSTDLIQNRPTRFCR
jgi:hypothetical protein